ncbi:helix-turn-helix transcriptional regulator [Rhodopseudomonas parapalustris]
MAVMDPSAFPCPAVHRQKPKTASYLRKTWDFVARIEQSPDAGGVERCLIELASVFGFTSVFGGVIPSNTTPSSEIASRIMIQHMPPGWKKRYAERNYVFRDPIVTHSRKARSPFLWEEAYARCECSSDVRLISGEAGEFGLCSGHVVPVQTLDGGVVAISFGGEAPEISEEAKSALTFAANYAVGRLLFVPRNAADPETRITARETECLLWAAEGKSDWEISVILGVSRPTILKHVRSVRDKLDAANRTHAVVKAIRRRLIR